MVLFEAENHAYNKDHACSSRNYRVCDAIYELRKTHTSCREADFHPLKMMEHNWILNILLGNDFLYIAVFK